MPVGYAPPKPNWAYWAVVPAARKMGTPKRVQVMSGKTRKKSKQVGRSSKQMTEWIVGKARKTTSKSK